MTLPMAMAMALPVTAGLPAELCKAPNAQEAVTRATTLPSRKLDARDQYVPTIEDKLLVVHQELIWNTDAQKFIVEIKLSFIDAGTFIESIGEVVQRATEFLSVAKILETAGPRWSAKMATPPPEPTLTRESYTLGAGSRIVLENGIATELYYTPAVAKTEVAHTLSCPKDKPCFCK